MTTSILFEPLTENQRSIRCLSPTWFVKVMAQAGFQLPCELNKTAIPVLRGMAATTASDAPNPFLQIIDAINTYGAISIWVEQ